MKYCNQCKVNIVSPARVCPLCRQGLSEGKNDDTFEMVRYPNADKERRRLRSASNLYILSAIVCELILILLWLNGFLGGHWNVCIMLGCFMIFVYAILWLIMAKRHSFSFRLTMGFLMAILLVIGVDYLTGGPGWSLNYFYPAALIVMEISIVIIMMVARRSWQSYMLVQILLIILSLIPFLLNYMGMIHSLKLANLSFVVTIVAFVYTILLGGKRGRDELRRRFHV